MTDKSEGNITADEAAARLQSIDWRVDERREHSQLILMREHLRRMAIWNEALGAIYDWPFFDVCTAIDVEHRASATLHEAVDRALVRKNRSSLERLCCSWYLDWVAWALSPKFNFRDLPGPYDALMLFFQRGGVLVREHDFIEIGIHRIRVGDWRRYCGLSTIVQLDEAHLDSIDKQ